MSDVANIGKETWLVSEPARIGRFIDPPILGSRMLSMNHTVPSVVKGSGPSRSRSAMRCFDSKCAMPSYVRA